MRLCTLLDIEIQIQYMIHKELLIVLSRYDEMFTDISEIPDVDTFDPALEIPRRPLPDNNNEFLSK